jgi:Na+/melibiose symporter-like transporter
MITPLNATNLTTDSAGAIQAKQPSQARAILALIYIFGLVYSVGYTPLQALYPVECLRYEIRAKGMGVYNISVNFAGFYNQFVTGIAFTNIGWKYYFLFIFWNILTFVFIYFFFVETSNRTIEELTEIFRSQYPVKTSLTKSEIIIRDDQIVVHEVDKVYY